MKHWQFLFALALLIALVPGCTTKQPESENDDWPMWRYDAHRSAASPQKLAENLHLLWVREYPQLEPTWDDPLNQDLMQFDTVYEPIIHQGSLFIGSNASDCLISLDTTTGEENWRFYVDGPVRFPAVANEGKVYFTSDDGYLYCVDAVKGTLLWKFQGAPSDRKILGNERLISTWPARGGPVLQDGTVYFAAGIWPFMGVFVYALDAESGQVVWQNDSTGARYMLQPHNSPAYAGVAPQGSLVIENDKLLVPCGRSVPACFDLQTGELLYYHLAKNGKTGGAFVCAAGDFFVNYHRDSVVSLYQLTTGEAVIRSFGKVPVMTKDTLFCRGDTVTALDLKNIRETVVDTGIVVDKKEQSIKTAEQKRWVLDTLWTCDVDASGDLIRAGRRLYAGGQNSVSAITILGGNRKAHVTWRTNLEGSVARLIVGDAKLIAVTREGRIYAFGERKPDAPRLHPYEPEKSTVAEETSLQAKSILQATDVTEGYCLVYDTGDGNLAEALNRNSNLRVIAVEPNQEAVDQLRHRFDAAGLHSKRLSVQYGSPETFQAPPYMASLVLFEDAATVDSLSDGALKNIYENIRPYGGVAYFPVAGDRSQKFMKRLQNLDLPKAEVRQILSPLTRQTIDSLKPQSTQGGVLLVRSGSLPGTSDWTHQYGDVANTVKSDDQLVKLPLGVLWFGGSSNMDVLPRHGHGPPEQVIGGRLFIQGMDSLSARDVYTGRVLWKRTISRLDNYGVYYDDTYKDTPLDTAYNQVHIPGANARGTNYVATEDRVYLALERSCLVLDPATGETIDEFRLPVEEPDGERPEWGYIGVYRNYLIAGAGFVRYLDYLDLDELDARMKKRPNPFYNFDITASKRLVVMDRHTGDVLWTRKAKLGFWHNSIIAANGRVFYIDRLPPAVVEALERRKGKFRFDPPELGGRNLSDGGLVWSRNRDVFGTWLSYSQEHGILIQAGRSSRDMLRGEPSGLSAHDAKNGSVLWSNDVSDGGPYILHGDTIITDRTAYSLTTGEQITRIDPLTGKESPWVFRRDYGCNYVVASEYLLTFRSAAAGFYDLLRDGGTGNFGGFKSSCTSTLVAANGVLNAPDYTRTCSCSYQNQTSLALVYMPELEMWTSFHSQQKENPIVRSPYAVSFTSLDGRILYANAACLKLFGKAKEDEFLGQSVKELLSGETQTMLRYAERAGRWSGILSMSEDDGASTDLHVLAQLISDDAGAPVALMLSFADMTDSAVAFTDLSGRLTYVNDAFLQLWRLSDEQEALVHTFTELWQDRQQAEVVMTAWRQSDDWAGELPMLRDDGSMRDVYVRSQVIRDELRKPLSTVISFIDVADRKVLVEDTQELASLLKEGGDIAERLAGNQPIRSVGINFGAPGDRRGDDGLLWLEYPSVGGPSPEVPIETLPEKPKTYSHHSSKFGGDAPKWVIASGMRGVSEITLTLDKSSKDQKPSFRFFTVRLYFAEPEVIAPGERLMDISLQGNRVLTAFDIASVAGGPHRGVMREFDGVEVQGSLIIGLSPSDGATNRTTLICGVEVVAEPPQI